MPVTTQIWQHRTSGEWFLVRVVENENGGHEDIVEACGPVTREDAEYTVNEGAGWFNSDLAVVEDIANNLDAYRTVFPYQSA